MTNHRLGSAGPVPAPSRLGATTAAAVDAAVDPAVEAAVDAVVEAAVEDALGHHDAPDVLPDALEDVLLEVGPDTQLDGPAGASSVAGAGVADGMVDTLEGVAAAATAQVYAPDPLADLPVDAPPVTAVWDPAGEALIAAARSGVVVRHVETHVDVAAAVAILDEVFAPEAGHHYYPPSLLRNLLAAGAPVLLAVDGEEALGVVLALPGWAEQGPVVQSGPMAVKPAARGRRIAVALKLAQRAWCLERGVSEVRWTFDLMNATNARLNLHTLRAAVVAFLPGYEGTRAPDSQALPNDRLLVCWSLDENRQPEPVRQEDPVAAVTDAVDGPVLDPAWVAARTATVALPADIGALRREAPELAARWQQVVGGVLRQALDDGWHVDVDPAGRYRLLAPG